MIRSDNNEKLISDSKSATLNTPKYTFLLFACDYLGWSPDCSGLPNEYSVAYRRQNFDTTRRDVDVFEDFLEIIKTQFPGH